LHVDKKIFSKKIPKIARLNSLTFKSHPLTFNDHRQKAQLLSECFKVAKFWSLPFEEGISSSQISTKSYSVQSEIKKKFDKTWKDFYWHSKFSDTPKSSTLISFVTINSWRKKWSCSFLWTLMRFF
jgi:hypothetical protein